MALAPTCSLAFTFLCYVVMCLPHLVGMAGLVAQRCGVYVSTYRLRHMIGMAHAETLKSRGKVHALLLRYQNHIPCLPLPYKPHRPAITALCPV
jgi:hypothetical protein